MKIKFTVSFLLISVISFSQEKINYTALERISSEASSKYQRELVEFSQKFYLDKNETNILQNQFAGFILGKPVFYHTEDSRQARATNTDLLYNNSIPGVQVTGNGMKVFQWDGGNVRTTHNDLNGRITNLESVTLSDHATGVAGVIMGAGTGTFSGINSRGMAYEASLSAYNFTNNISEISNESSNSSNSNYMISNHSYGVIAGWQDGDYGMGNGWYWFGYPSFSETESVFFGYYGQDDSSLDAIAFNAPQHTIVKSAGNDNNQGPTTTPAQHWAYDDNGNWQQFNNLGRPRDCGVTGFDCIPTSSLAKNIITVGAVNGINGRYTQPSDVVAASFTGFGPADDGRIKPDVVAVGVQALAPNAGSNNGFSYWNGTSFSSPAVTGNITLLQQLYEQQNSTYLRSDLTKALVIHTANEAGDAPGPDYKFGWGLMDAAKAAELIMGKDETAILRNHTLNNGETYKFSVRGIENQPLKVTIVWLDPSAPVGAGHNDRTPQLINDLDLRISDGLVEYQPWKLDVNNPSAAATRGDNVLDNVEQVIIDQPINGLNYEISVAHKGNLQDGSQVFAIVVSGAVFCPSATIWDGLSWSNGLPDFNTRAIVNGDLVLTQNLEACELEINATGSLTVQSGVSLNVNGGIVNRASAEDFVILKEGNLIQNEDYENFGEITVIRDSQPMKRLDYTLWSSPVTEQNLFGFSPQTVNGVTNYPGSIGRIYIYNGTNGYVNPTPFNADAVFNPGTGYLFRAPNNWSSTVETPYIGIFKGIPTNGNVNVATVAGSFTSVGNPYPSNVDADLLMDENIGITSLYFWNNTGNAGNNYAAYTSLGGVAAGGGSEIPNGIISAGQGLIVETADPSVNFNNSMRTDNAAYFFKSNQNNRIWIDLNNEQNERLNQILIGYSESATNDVDLRIEAKLFGYEGSALYSLINDKKFSIQGRALPFENSDFVTLGFKALEAGKFNISLYDFDGLFTEGNVKVYLKDKNTNTVHNLTESAYTFESAAGEFNERFEIIYEKQTLETDDLAANSLQIYKNKQNIVVESKSEKILSVELFDLSGRNIHANNKVNANTYQIKSVSKGVIIVKVQTQKGEVGTKKLIFE